MTKNEFIGFLESSLDFLDSKEKKSVLDFFHEKFSFCGSVEEENAMMEAFGTPEKFIEKLRGEKGSFSKKNKKKNRSIKGYLESILKSSLPTSSIDNSDTDVIFSKPISTEKASEVVHSLEDREVKTLFGEKVVIEDRSEPVKEIVLEPIDEANGLTTEEIRIAKARTLEKAEHFTDAETATPVNSDDRSNEVDSRIPLEEEEQVADKNCKSGKIIDKKDYFGLFNRIIPQEKFEKTPRIALLILLTLAVSPLIFAAFGLVVFVYAGLVAFTVAVSLALFAVMIAIIAIGVVELVHGFLLLFDSIPAALIELGFGTILFSFVTAIAALIYEFIFGIVPKWLKWITKIFVHYTKLLYCYLYGGKA